MIAVLEHATASQATVSSKNRVCAAPCRAYGTAATITDRAQVQSPPPAPSLPLVVARPLLPAGRAPAGQPVTGPHVHGDRQLPGVALVPVHALDHGVFAAEHLSP